MHSSIQKIHAQLAQLHGCDIALLTSEEVEELRTTVSKGFIEATGGLHTLLLGEQSDSPRWMWTAEKEHSFGGELFASYTMLDTGRLEAVIGESERVRMAAAICPAVKLTVNIFAGYHHPGGTGLQVDPRISIVLSVSGDPELALVEHYLKLSNSFFPRHGEGLIVDVTPRECCCDPVRNPLDLYQTFSHVAKSARIATLEQEENNDTTLTETIEIELTMDETLSVERMENAFEYMGNMFKTVVVSQQ